MIHQNVLESSTPLRATLATPLPSVDRPSVPWLNPPPGPWTVERAYAYCEEFARTNTERVGAAPRLVQAEVLPHLIALYAFARGADDFADEPAYEGRRMEALDHWKAELRRSCHGEATHPVFVALADTIKRRHLPIPPLEDVLSAFRVDMDVRRYATFDELRAYTARSAEPVGRLLLALFGYWRPDLVRFADEICTALQLTNFWQDIGADAARDHVYIPAEDLHFFGVSEADVKALKPTRSLRDLLRFEVARTRACYERGRPLLEELGDDLGPALARVCLAGTTVLDRIEAADFDVFTDGPASRRRDRAMVGALTMSQ